MKIKFSFTDPNYLELVQRANFLGISRTATILLHWYLYEATFSDYFSDNFKEEIPGWVEYKINDYEIDPEDK